MTSQPITILLVIAIFLVSKPVTTFLAVLLAFLRVPITACKADRDPPLSACNADQAVVLNELFSLGFGQNASQVDYEQAGQRIATWYFVHQQKPVIAGLSDRIDPMTLQSLSFYSFTSGGDTVLTTNRSGAYFGHPEQPRVLHQDSMSATLAQHWMVHLDRVQELQCVPVETCLAISRIVACSEFQFEWLRQCGSIHQVDGHWHYRFLVALKRTLHWQQMVRRSSTPYTPPVPLDREAVLRQRFALFELYNQSMQRRGRRRDIKLMAFIVTLLLALVAWGWLFTWPTALALIAIIFIHESGHAAAMWLFGQRDISLFFIPFVGAVVTAKAGQLAAWQQMIILLAGPLPGLLIGSALLIYANSDAFDQLQGWQGYALLAIFVNLFNLLPIGFLDGGQLVELAAFARMPKARFIFNLLSVFALVAVARYSNGVAAWVIAGAVALSLWPQFQMMRLAREWREGLSEKEQVANLLQACMRQGMVNFARQYSLIRGVMARQAMKTSRLWESTLILGTMATIWIMALGIFYGGWFADSFGIS